VVALSGGDHGPHLGRRIQRIADAQPAGGLAEQRGHTVIHGTLDEDAAARAAVLARVAVDGGGSRLRRAFEVGVGEDDVW
jgi:hypothetical protein